MIQYYIQSKSNESVDFALLIDTTKAGTAVGFTIPVASGETYLYDVDWGDGTTTANHTGSSTHTYAVDGVYQVRITGNFPRFYFNNAGDKLKVIEILNWGQTGFSTDQSNAFYGLVNLISIPSHSDEWYNSITVAPSMFRNTILTSLPSNMTLASLTNGVGMFRDILIQSLPSGMTLDSLTNGDDMFRGSSLESLPSGMILNNVTSATYMFSGTNLLSLPSTMTLASLSNGGSLFRNTSLESLPSGMMLNNLTIGSYMFLETNLQSLPSTMTLSNLTNGSFMFSGTNLQSLPSGMTLSNLTNGSFMFDGNTINTARYSQLLIDMNANNSNNNVPFHGGNSKYNAAGETARNALLARGWTITDGGLEV